jgi:hypothetical protein
MTLIVRAGTIGIRTAASLPDREGRKDAMPVQRGCNDAYSAYWGVIEFIKTGRDRVHP